MLMAVVLGLSSTGTPGPGHAQPAPAGEPDRMAESTADRRVLRAVYHVEAPALRITMRAADASAFPVYYGAPVAAWGGAGLIRDTNHFADAYRLTVTQAATYGSVLALKRLIRRPRPYQAIPGICARKPQFQRGGAERGSLAMPSGHASLAAALVTSWSLSHPKWYVIAPGAVWASSVALSRVWLGVHYPSDILAGMLLGTGIGVGVHWLGPALTPAFLEDEDGGAPPPMLNVQIRF